MATVRVKKIYKNAQGDVISERAMTFTQNDWDVIRKNPQTHDGAIFQLLPTKVVEAQEVVIVDAVKDETVISDTSSVVAEIVPSSTVSRTTRKKK